MIYLASPYGHPDATVREVRFQQACRAAATLMRCGIPVFSPVAHSHPIAQHGLPTSWEFWRAVDLEYLLQCEALVLLRLPGWERSVGVRAEIALARQWGMPVIELDPKALAAAEGRKNGRFAL
ncbi:MAG: DUF1937 domain-containing protein [Planctomycetota bacterium]|nr:MAG: DUF1937 domain-containing protein [Planctomycetota bacterium]